MSEVAESGCADSGIRRIELGVTGMFCGVCARRIENTLNKIDGVQASVDFGTRTATIDASYAVSVADLCSAVEGAGYGAQQSPAGVGPSGGSGGASHIAGVLRRLVGPAVLITRRLKSRRRDATAH